MKPLNTLRRVVHNTDTSAQVLSEIREGTANQSSLINDKMMAQIAGTREQSSIINDKLNHLIAVAEAQLTLQHQQNLMMAHMIKAMSDSKGAPVPEALLHVPDTQSLVNGIYDRQSSQGGKYALEGGWVTEGETFEQAMAAMPLMIAEKTFNTAHPAYDARAARNFPGKIFNYNKPCANVVYKELLTMANGAEVPEKAWRAKLPSLLEEARSVPGADQIFERKAYIEKYMADLSKKYNAHYVPGWVNLDDALFLYWVVRTLKPKTIVQTGVCNGLSSSFMMLALAKNGPEGKLYVVDMPPVFDSTDPNWTRPKQVYGVCIPEGKSSGWIVPDMYKDRFIVQTGDAKIWLPKVMEQVTDIDLFYHDSDHTYNHMMFEFAEAKKKLNPGGVILGDDVSWNASVWDFADQYGVPSYNYLGTVGAAFF